MTPTLQHRIPPEMIRDWNAGRLAQPFGVVVAAHVSLCDESRAEAEADDLLGGLLLEEAQGQPLEEGAEARLLAALDGPAPAPRPRASTIFPAPVMAALGGSAPKWRALGGGIRQQILIDTPEGSLRLLYIPPGRAVPEHGHGGLELTLVLQGSFSDSEGTFARGDVEVAYGDVEHQPVAGPGLPCICLAATDAPLRFRGWVPRLLQPLFRI